MFGICTILPSRPNSCIFCLCKCLAKPLLTLQTLAANPCFCLRLQKAQAAAEAEANRKAALQAGKEAALKNKAKVRPPKPLFEIVLVSSLVGDMLHCNHDLKSAERDDIIVPTEGITRGSRTSYRKSGVVEKELAYGLR
jgi:hypothetical protein